MREWNFKVDQNRFECLFSRLLSHKANLAWEEIPSFKQSIGSIQV